MTESKIKIRGGRIKPDEDQLDTPAEPKSQELPVRTHAPGQTFHPGGIGPAKDGAEDAPGHPVSTEESPPEKSDAVSAEVPTPTPKKSDIKPPEPRAPEPPMPKPVAPQAPEPFAQTGNDGPLKIHKEPSSFMVGLGKTLLWLLISIAVLTGLALGAIYFFKI